MSEMASVKKPQLLYITGIPGSGKTTLMQALTADAAKHVQYMKPFGLINHEWPNGTVIWEIGATRAGGFGGTDALGMSVQPKVVDWLGWQRPERVIAEGDRLGNTKFFNAVVGLGYYLRIVVLEIPEDVALRRRTARAAALGTKPQNEVWVKGRTTKVQNIAANWLAYSRFVDATRSPQDIAAAVRGAEPIFGGM
jgi:energy-coupling factor transporter ATP-binding protein EcfA2